MTDCPPRLRGDLSKWLCEISPGVYVGQVSGRVREALWERVCQNVKTGRAVMVFSSNKEQKMDFRVHNTTWQPVDFDGIQLMRRPLPQREIPDTSLQPGFSKAAKRQMAERRKRIQGNGGRYVLIDLEKTGLLPWEEEILELGALRVADGEPVGEYSCLVWGRKEIPTAVTRLTHITEELRQQQGRPLKEALDGFLEFIGDDRLVGFNISFDLEFLRRACEECGQPMLANPCVDLQALARRKVRRVPNYKLVTLAEHFSLTTDSAHRALEDCRLAYQVYCKLKEN